MLTLNFDCFSCNWSVHLSDCHM